MLFPKKLDTLGSLNSDAESNSETVRIGRNRKLSSSNTDSCNGKLESLDILSKHPKRTSESRHCSSILIFTELLAQTSTLRRC